MFFFFFFLSGINFRKYVKFASGENKKSLAPKYSGAFNKKRLPLFDKSLMTLEYLHQTMLSFKAMRFCSMFGSKHKKDLWKTDRKTPLPESIFNNLNFSKNGFHHSRFPANFLKVFKKRRTAAL